MKKKVLSLLFIVTLLASLFTGCSSKSKDSTTADPTATVTPTIAPNVLEEPQITTEVESVAEQEPTIKLEEPTEIPSKDYPIEAIETAGTIDGITYSNRKIGFSISVPKSWLLFGTEETYNYIAKSLGYSEKEIPTLKEEVRAKGVTYLFYGNDTQLSKNGNADRLTAEAINIELFKGLGIEDIIDTLSKASVDQYTANGGTCEVSDPIKINIEGQDIYEIPTTVSYEAMDGDSSSKEKVNLINIIFQRDDTVVYMILSTDLEDSDKLVEVMIQTVSFQ